jgi:uncharacterized membrane protein
MSPVALSVYGSGNHRHPVPGETQVLRWTVRNDGTRALDGVALDVKAPADWVPHGRPVHRAHGVLEPGDAWRVTIRLRVPGDPRLGSFEIVGRVHAEISGREITGPSARFPVTVVRNR